MTKIQHYDFTYKDFLMLRKVGKQKKTKLAKHDFTDTTVFKPWGFEYIIYEDKDVVTLCSFKNVSYTIDHIEEFKDKYRYYVVIPRKTIWRVRGL